jgi:hypothetical protein
MVLESLSSVGDINLLKYSFPVVPHRHLPVGSGVGCEVGPDGTLVGVGCLDGSFVGVGRKDGTVGGLMPKLRHLLETPDGI